MAGLFWRCIRAFVVYSPSTSKARCRATLAPMPLVAVYTASKMAIEGFTGSLAIELASFGIRAKLVEPGYGPTTSFTANGGARVEGMITEPYAPLAQSIFAALGQAGVFTVESDVAEVVMRAATDAPSQLRFPAGPDAVALANGN
jgi:NAD(P)-dependent dehydrogenase (short-subunit alcohol dehydrogenase family)